MQDPIEIAKVNRTALKKMLAHYSLDQLNTVPEGFNNSLFWNIAHVVVTQQLLVYKLSGVPMLIDDQLVNDYKKGTKFERPATQQEVDQVNDLLFSTLEQTAKDIKDGRFGSFTEYPTSTGYVLTSLDDAIHFNNFHEGIHLGYILALKKQL